MTEINSDVFSGCTSLIKVTIPDSVTEIYSDVFSGCTNLSDVTLSKNLVDLGSNVFEGCKSLKEIVLPKDITYINDNMFSESGLETITIPENVVEIGDYAFESCSSLREVVFNKKIKRLSSTAFYDCDALVSIEIPNSVVEIEEYWLPSPGLFESCDNLETVKISAPIEELCERMFKDCYKLKTVELPYTLTNIGSNVFVNCTALEEIFIPRNVVQISDDAFSYYENLTICGISGTYAEQYANDREIKFQNKEIPATSIILDVNSIEMSNDSEAKLNFEILPSSFTDAVSFKSSNTDVVTVDNNGNIESHEAGEATIKMVVGNLSKTIKVIVKQNVTGINIGFGDDIYAGQTIDFTADVYPDTAYNKEIHWTSSNEKVASVDKNGHVVGLSKGTTEIRATAMDGSGEYDCATVNVLNNLYIVNSVSDLESSHNYLNDCQDVWVYTLKDATSIKVKFNEKTIVEEGFDYIYLFDSNDNEIGVYTGNELAGKEIIVKDCTIKIQIKSDAESNEYGFKVDSVETVAIETIKSKQTIASISSSTYSSVCLKWSEICGAEKYIVYYSSSETSGYKKYAIYNGDIRSATVNKLTTGKTYYFKVRGYSNGEYSKYSSVVSKKLILEKPTLQSVTKKTYKSIEVQWSGVAGASYYEVWRKESGKEWKKIKTYSKDDRSALIGSLKTGTKYYFKVRAKRYSGSDAVYSSYSSYDYATPILDATKATIKKLSSTSAKVSWKAICGVSKYEVYRRINSGSYARIKTLNNDARSLTVKSLKKGYTYSYKVRAYRLVNNKKVYNTYSNVVKIKL